MAIAATCRGANSDKDSFSSGNRRAKIKIEMQPSSLDIARHKLGQTGLVNRHFTLVDFLNFRQVFIDASDMKSKFGKTRPRDKTDISSANDCNFHNIDSYYRPKFDNRQAKFDQSKSLGRRQELSPNRILAFFMARFKAKVT